MKTLCLFLALTVTASAQWSNFSGSTASSNLYNAMNGKKNIQFAAGSPSALNCTVGYDEYVNTTNFDVYGCSVTGTPGTWVKTGSILLAGTNITLSSGAGGTTISATSGSSAPSFPTNAQTATYQLLAGDFSSFKTILVSSGTFTITGVASTSQPAGGTGVWIINYGTGVVTFARSGQNINGAAANLTIPAGSASAPNGLFVVSDGTNYFAQPLGVSSASGTVTSVGTNNGLTGGTITSTGTVGLATIANNAALCNNSGGTAVPTSANCTVTGTGSLVMATNAGLLAGSSLGTSTGSGISIPGTSLTAGDVYYQASGGLTLAEANSSSTVPGICLATTTTSCSFSGVYRFGSSQSWTTGNILYVSDSSAGAIVTTAPSTSGHFVQRIGIALAADTMLILPSIDVGAVQ